MPRLLPVLALTLLLSSASHSQEQTQTPAQPPEPCSSEEHRQFDFWIGEWSVTQADGSVAGQNSIQPILNGCVLFEQWQGAGGSTGKSFNMYDAAEGIWRQTWVDGNGGRLDLAGGLDGDDMVLSGERPGRDGGVVTHEIRWSREEDGTVEQYWRASRDGGETWSELFVGVYSQTE